MQSLGGSSAAMVDAMVGFETEPPSGRAVYGGRGWFKNVFEFVGGGFTDGAL